MGISALNLAWATARFVSSVCVTWPSGFKGEDGMENYGGGVGNE